MAQLCKCVLKSFLVNMSNFFFCHAYPNSLMCPLTEVKVTREASKTTR